jgi:hypothetical protein
MELLKIVFFVIILILSVFKNCIEQTKKNGKQIICCCSKSSTITKWIFKNNNFDNKKNETKFSLKNFTKISSPILQLIFEYLHEPDEFKNFIKFLQTNIPYAKDKLDVLPQKLTKIFLNHRFYMTQKTDLILNEQNIIEYFYSENSKGRFNHSFPIFQMIVFTLFEKKTFTLILYKNGNLEYECSKSVQFKPGHSLPENWNQNVFSVSVSAHDMISICNKNLNILININVNCFFDKQKPTIQFYLSSSYPYIQEYFRAPLHLGFSDIRLFDTSEGKFAFAKKHNWNKKKHLISIEKLRLIFPTDNLTSFLHPDKIFHNDTILKTYKNMFKREKILVVDTF